MRNFDYTNSFLLDVGMVANIGGPLWGQTAFTNYTISGNAIRLRGVPESQSYRSYEWITNTVGSFTAIMPVTDTTLPIGRFETGCSVGVQLAATDELVFSNNRFTNECSERETRARHRRRDSACRGRCGFPGLRRGHHNGGTVRIRTL